jgi:hypothetical protein
VSSNEEEVVNLEDLTKAEIQDVADEKGVDWSDSDTKAELIAKIHAVDVEEGDVPDESEVGAPPDSFPGSVASELYPERRPIEVDLANVDPGDGEGEHMAPLNAESWVVLDGSHDLVDDRYDGKIAAVIDWPTSVEHDTNTGETITYLPPEAMLTVKESSQGALMHLPLDAFKEIHTNGRGAVLGFA